MGSMRRRRGMMLKERVVEARNDPYSWLLSGGGHATRVADCGTLADTASVFDVGSVALYTICSPLSLPGFLDRVDLSFLQPAAYASHHAFWSYDVEFLLHIGHLLSGFERFLDR